MEWEIVVVMFAVRIQIDWFMESDQNDNNKSSGKIIFIAMCRRIKCRSLFMDVTKRQSLQFNYDILPIRSFSHHSSHTNPHHTVAMVSGHPMWKRQKFCHIKSSHTYNMLWHRVKGAITFYCDAHKMFKNQKICVECRLAGLIREWPDTWCVCVSMCEWVNEV